MKLDVWGVPRGEEKAILLRLMNVENGVIVCVVNKYGNRLPLSNLVKFHDSGRVSRCRSVDRDIGFNLTDEGRITTCGEDEE